MSEDYLKVLQTCKHALCTLGVKGKDSIDRLLGCILLLEEKDITAEQVNSVIATLNRVSVGGIENLQLMYDVITILEQVRDGTFDVSQLQEEPEEVMADGG